MVPAALRIPILNVQSVDSFSPSVVQVGMHAGCAGGLDRYFCGLIQALRDAGRLGAAFVFGEDSFHVADRTYVLGPATVVLYRRLVVLHRALATALRAHRQHRPKVLVTHFPLYAVPLLRMIKQTNCSHVVHFHGPWALESAAQGGTTGAVLAKGIIERIVYRSADRIIALSDAFGGILKERYGIPPERIRVIPGGIDVQRFVGDACKVSRLAARQRLGLPVGGALLVSVRRLTHRMGLDRLIDAVRIVRTCAPKFDVHLAIAGKGAGESLLRAQVDSLGLNQHVTLLGFVPEGELPFLYRAADLSVVPSQCLEGFGLVLLESLAVGTPVMVTPVGGMPEVIKPFEPDLITEGVSAESIAGRILELVRKERRLPGPRECQTYVAGSYSWNAILPRVLRIYEEASAGGVSRHASRFG